MIVYLFVLSKTSLFFIIIIIYKLIWLLILINYSNKVLCKTFVLCDNKIGDKYRHILQGNGQRYLQISTYIIIHIGVFILHTEYHIIVSPVTHSKIVHFLESPDIRQVLKKKHLKLFYGGKKNTKNNVQ